MVDFGERLYKLENIDKFKLKLCLKDFFSKEDVVFASYLFGSFLKEDLCHDLDIGIFTKGPLDEFRMGSKVEGYLFRKGFKVPVDLKVLNDAPLWVKYDVVSKGERIYPELNEKIVEFEAGIIGEYFDFEYLKDEYNRMFLQRLKR